MPKTKIKPKHNLDKFYTKEEEVKRLLSFVNLTGYDLSIEPSAGNGVWVDNMDHYNIMPYDIETDNKNIILKDWFDVDIPKRYNDVCVVGNPPFGSRNILSKKFIQHAISFNSVNMIAFILPKVWRKPTLQKTFPRDWSLVIDEDVSDNSFLLDNKDYHVNTTFQVWKKNYNGVDLRWDEYPELTHIDFEFSDADNGDFYVMGASPKTIKLPEEVNSKNRGYWIKANIDVEQLKTNIKSIDWNKYGCSSVSGGVYWITKAEFIKIYKENGERS